MWRFIRSFFGSKELACSYPDALVHAAIERTVEGTDPWIRGVSGYKRKLRPAVLRAIDYVVELVDGIAPPLGLEPANYGSDARLRNFFISGSAMGNFLAGDPALSSYRRQAKGGSSSPINALLAMEKREKTILGTALAGEIVQHDVSQVAVSFEDHRLMDPAASEKKTRRQLKRRAFDHLLSLAQHRISMIKTERSELERHRAHLQAKLDLQQRFGRDGHDVTSEGTLTATGLRAELDRIEQRMLTLGRDDRILDVYLDVVCDVLGRPEEHLWLNRETLILDRMGIKRAVPADDAPEVTLDVVQNVEGRSLVVSLVTLTA